MYNVGNLKCWKISHFWLLNLFGFVAKNAVSIISDALRSVLEASIFKNFPGGSAPLAPRQGLRLDGASRRRARGGATRRKVSEFKCGLPSEKTCLECKPTGLRQTHIRLWILLES